MRSLSRIKASVFLSVSFFSVQLCVDGLLPLFGIARQDSLSHLALLPSAFREFSQPYALLSSLFLHTNWLALFYSIWILFVPIRLLEQELGSKRVLLLFLVAGFCGLLPILIFKSDAYALYYGAQSGVWGLMAVCTLFYPRTPVKFLFGQISFGWLMVLLWLANLPFLAWDDLLQDGSWMSLSTGTVAGIAYAWLGLGLMAFNKMQTDARIWYLKIPSRQQSTQSYLTSIQNQTKPHNPMNAPHQSSQYSRHSPSAADLLSKPGLKSPTTKIPESFSEQVLAAASGTRTESNPTDSQKPAMSNPILSTNATPKNPTPSALTKIQDAHKPVLTPTAKKLLYNTKTGEYYYK